ncbi:MAG: YvrJ family protein [Syntrophomonadaceae bacterium]|jgi:hypothetical protein|nr:YvrJ family protein [Syntrophomonadaceae bacterium]MDH7496914.1 YvrJ family protein [Syntrophomonadaceae bacterium]
MEELLTQVGNYGFPVVVSLYLLVRIEQKLENLTRAVVGVREALLETRA